MTTATVTRIALVAILISVAMAPTTPGPSNVTGHGFLVGGLPSAYAASDAAKDLKKRFKRAMKRGDPRQVAAFIKRAAKVDDPDVAPLMIHAAIAIPSAKNYQRALKGIQKYKDKETIEVLIELGAKSKKYQERVLIVEGFGRRTGGTAAEEVRTAIYRSLRKDSAVHVRVAAIMACSGRKEREAVPVLIDHLESRQKERDRDWIECRQALLDLTGENFELIADWRNFWEANKTSLDPKSIGKKKDGKTGRRRVKVKKSDASAEFFGEEIHSQNVVFVIDCSGSMQRYDPHPKYRGKNEERDRERLRRAKLQTTKAIRKLKKKSRFNVIAFNSQVYSWKKRVAGASHGNVKKAKKFVEGFNATMMTHTLEALEEAFKDPGVDTIVLLSDGYPYQQDMEEAEALAYAKRILKRIKDLNASRKLTINTFGFDGPGKAPGRQGGGGGSGGTLGGGGQSGVAEFLTRLAKRNNGKYKSIK